MFVQSAAQRGKVPGDSGDRARQGYLCRPVGRLFPSSAKLIPALQQHLSDFTHFLNWIAYLMSSYLYNRRSRAMGLSSFPTLASYKQILNEVVVMTPTWYTFVVVALLCLEASGLLESSIVDFQEDSGSIPISHADIICSQDDEIGVHIAVGNLASDLQQITGVDRSVFEWQDSGDSLSTSSDHTTAIIAGSLNSSLIQHLANEGHIDVSDLEGKWETFMTTVVAGALPSVDRALVIAGSDKRGTIFGIYTVSEQSGQSP